MKRVPGFASAVIYVGLCVICARNADAQDPWPTIFRPLVTQSEFESLAGNLPGLEDDQRIIFDALFRGYVASLNETSARLRPLRDAAQERIEELCRADPSMHPETVIRESGLGEILKQAREEAAALREEFLKGLEAVLFDDQRTGWLRMQRTLERARILPDVGRHAPVRPVPDLSTILKTVATTDSSSHRLSEIVEEYEETLAELLDHWEAKRAAVTETIGVLVSAAGGREKIEHGRISALESRLDSLADQIRATSAVYEGQIAAALPLEERQAFLRAAWTAELPQVFVPSPIELLGERLEYLDLDARAATRLANICEQNLDQLDAKREQMVRTVRRHATASSIRARVKWQVNPKREEMTPPEDTLGEAVRPILWDVHRINGQACRELRQAIDEATFRDLPADVKLLLTWSE